jgi:hypothetical protein
MKKTLIFLFVTFILVYQIHSQNENIAIEDIPASQRLVPTFNENKDLGIGFDTTLVILAKELILNHMDSLEKMFGEKFEKIPFIKFEIPKDISPTLGYKISGAYRGKEEAIYFVSFSCVLHLTNLQSQKPRPGDEYLNGYFQKVAVHELGHWYHDILMRRLTGDTLDIPPTNQKLVENIEYELVVEGIAEWIERIYSKDTTEYVPLWYFPPNMNPESWRTYGLSMVGPIFDLFGKKGIEYVVLHPFEIRNKFTVAEDAKNYQNQAIESLKKHNK